MASGLNKCTFIGNLGQDPEVRYAKSGAPVANLSIACNERRKVGDNWEEHTEWIRVVCFGKTAENVGQYLSKGRQVYVEGRMQTRKYQDRDGNDKWSTEIVANNILFLGSGNGAQQENGNGSKRNGSGSGNDSSKDAGFYDDDLPF